MSMVATTSIDYNSVQASPKSAFELLNPELQRIVSKRGFARPTLAQQLAIPRILKGKNVLLIASVGAGKTEGGLLPIFNFIMKHRPRPISTLYITPLKSLNRDLLRRLLWWCEEIGIDAYVRHGDTTAYERRKQVEFPARLMIITLEQLQPMLVGSRLRQLLRNVKHVIIDEVHELVGSKRGIQLSLALERLRELCGDFQLVMLSATVGDAEGVASYFSGGHEVEVIQAISPKQFDIRVACPRPTAKDRSTARRIYSSAPIAARLRRIAGFVQRHEGTLTFTNTRDFAEVLASRMRMLSPELELRVHHSSLSKEVRIGAERDFKAKRVKSIICTSSLQLGLDIGHVDAVLQYQSPRQITQLVQRVGRSGHALDKVSKGLVIATDEDDVFEASVIARKALRNELERMRFHRNSLDVLAHQLVGLSMEYGRIEPQKAYEIVTRANPYRELSYADFLSVCKQLQELGLIWLDGWIRKRRRGIRYYFEQLSTIPSIKQYRIFNLVDNSFVGVLDEEFVVLHGRVGTSFIVKGEAWKIMDIAEGRVVVEPTVDLTAAIPGWEGELIPVPHEVAQEVGKLRGVIAERLEDEGLRDWLRKTYPIDSSCVEKMISIVERQMEASVVPTDETLLLEGQGDVVILHACFGSLANEALGRLLSALLAARVGSVALRTDPYRIMLRWPNATPELVKDVIREAKPEHVRSYLELSLARSSLFEWRFMHVAKRFGAIGKEVRTPSIVRMRKIIEEYVGTPIYRETLNEIEVEKIDIKRACKILRDLRAGKLRLVLRRGISPLGELGLKKAYAEVIPPARPEKEVLELLSKRISRSRVKLLCLNCCEWERIYSVEDLPIDPKCGSCGARLLAVAKPDLDALRIARKASSGAKLDADEKAALKRLRRTAELFLTYGPRLVRCLVVPGVGPETAVRILAKHHETEEDLLKALLRAERRWLLTRKFWLT